jgi:hypothetical protein
MGMELEIAKIFVPAVLGFFVGRFQTSFTDKVSRAKDIQNELLKAIRSCTSSAIDYHSLTLAREQWPVKAFHLKQQLLRIRTDVYIVKDLCGRKDDLLQSKLFEFVDSVTAYPFEAAELPEEVDNGRFGKISLSAEQLVEILTTCRPKLF